MKITGLENKVFKFKNLNTKSKLSKTLQIISNHVKRQMAENRKMAYCFSRKGLTYMYVLQVLLKKGKNWHSFRLRYSMIHRIKQEQKNKKVILKAIFSIRSLVNIFSKNVIQWFIKWCFWKQCVRYQKYDYQRN